MHTWCCVHVYDVCIWGCHVLHVDVLLSSCVYQHLDDHEYHSGHSSIYLPEHHDASLNHPHASPSAPSSTFPHSPYESRSSPPTNPNYYNPSAYPDDAFRTNAFYAPTQTTLPNPYHFSNLSATRTEFFPADYQQHQQQQQRTSNTHPQ